MSGRGAVVVLCVFAARAADECSDGPSPAAVLPRGAQPNSGIVLPSEWPPRAPSMEHFVTNPPPAYEEPPYVRSPPPLIWVDVGRQLFIDDFLIERTNLTRRWHQAKVRSRPVIKPDRSWEHGKGNTARPFGGGVLLNPLTQTVLLWYRCGWRGKTGKTCVAQSKDGVTFAKTPIPKLKENIVIETSKAEGFEVVYDHLSQPPRFLALRMEYMTGGKKYDPYMPYESPDGLHWKRRPKEDSPGIMADRSTFFLNPFRRVWVLSLRENLCSGGPSKHMRARRYFEHAYAHFLPAKQGATTSHKYTPFLKSYYQCQATRPNDPVPWFAVDRSDCAFGKCDVYNVDGLAYESILVHGLAVLTAPYIGGELKNNSIHLGFSRDGFHISRPPAATAAQENRKLRTPFISMPSSASNLQLASGSPILMREGTEEEELFFFFGYGTKAGFDLHNNEGSVYSKYEELTGLAALRRDGFVSLSSGAPGDRPGAGGLTTRPLGFSKENSLLFVNVRLGKGGSLKVEALSGDDARPLCGASGPDAALLRGPIDSTRKELSWPGLRKYAGQSLRFRFTLERGELYSFWVSSSSAGHSRGYLAGGALGRSSILDAA